VRLWLKVANAVIALLCVCALLYTSFVYLVLDSLTVTGEQLWWRTSPPGSLFPIPQRSGVLQALSQVSELDKTLYYTLIANNLLILINLALIVTLTAMVLYTRGHRGT